MYYPYLRAKQYELKALKEFSVEQAKQNSILPILEPVKQQTSALEIAIEEMIANELKFALILNPNDGDFKHPNITFDLWKHNKSMGKVKNQLWIPAFLYSINNAQNIAKTINDNCLQNVMLIFKTCMSIDDNIAWKLINNTCVEYVVNAFGSTVSRRLKNKLQETAKQIIRLDDCFKSKTRNADYALEVDELFSEEPFYYESEDKFNGYSDYTTLPSDYVEGGMLPYALAIHFSYRKNADQLFVHHFVSDSNETNTDIRGKFKEAAGKIEPFYNGKTKTAAVKEIIAKAKDPNGYPGLGYLKKLSIKNHLELILSL